MSVGDLQLEVLSVWVVPARRGVVQGERSVSTWAEKEGIESRRLVTRLPGEWLDWKYQKAWSWRKLALVPRWCLEEQSKSKLPTPIIRHDRNMAVGHRVLPTQQLLAGSSPSQSSQST